MMDVDTIKTEKEVQSEDAPLFGFSRATARCYRIDSYIERDEYPNIAVSAYIVDQDAVPDDADVHTVYDVGTTDETYEGATEKPTLQFETPDE